jgi:hypothetical protein
MKKLALAMVISMVLATSALAQDDYFIYANFNSANTGGVYMPGQGCGGYKIDQYSGNLYVARGDQYCDVYLVSIPAGSDPNTHPDNPENTGTMVTRTLIFVGSRDISIDIGGSIYQSISEFYVDANNVYYGPSPGGIHKWTKNPDGTLGAYQGKVVNVGLYCQTLAFDAVNNIWYAGTVTPDREIYSFKPGASNWTYEFTYPSYAGSHHDGLEYAGGYLWISDMTSDRIGKWRYTGTGPYNGWAELAVYDYSGGAGMDVEGMGYGPLGHFWATGWNEMYELGGGGLIVEPSGIPALSDWGLIIFGVVLLGFISRAFIRRRKVVVSDQR